MIQVACPACRSAYEVPDAAAGKKVRCPKPKCATITTAPAEDEVYTGQAIPSDRLGRAAKTSNAISDLMGMGAKLFVMLVALMFGVAAVMTYFSDK